MSRPQTFHTISEYFPFRRSRAPKLDTRSARIHSELEGHTYDTVHFELAAALAKADADDGIEPPETITPDAHDLACRMLPADMVDLFGLVPKQPDNVAFEADLPSLRGLYLLVHAYDRTHDAPLRHAIEYILAKTPPQFSEQLGEAYSSSLTSGAAVLAEYQRLAAAEDDALDGTPPSSETKEPDATQASGRKLGKTALNLRKN